MHRSLSTWSVKLQDWKQMIKLLNFELVTNSEHLVHSELFLKNTWTPLSNKDGDDWETYFNCNCDRGLFWLFWPNCFAGKDVFEYGMEEAGIIMMMVTMKILMMIIHPKSEFSKSQVTANLFVFSSNFWTENAKSMKSALSVLPCRNGLVILP